jgi:predicted phosphodiesterase
MKFQKGNQARSTYKREIALQLIQSMPNASTMALSRILFDKNPLDFDNFEQARMMIRYYRKEHPRSSRTIIVGQRTNKTKKQFMAKNFELPESDYEKTIDLFLPSDQNNVLVLSDIHIPYQDNRALELALNYGIKHKVNAIYLNGDTIDMYQGSRFVKDRRLRDLAGELELTREFLQLLKNTFNVPIYFKIGNHEKRWEDYLRLKAPELLGIDDFKLDKILRFTEFNCTLIKDRQIGYIGRLPILHGHEWFAGFAPPVNPARGLFLKAKESCLIGHHHTTSEHTEKSLGGKITTCWSTGCLSGLEPEYNPFNKYNHGFAHVTTTKDGSYKVKNIRIIDYKIV